MMKGEYLPIKSFDVDVEDSAGPNASSKKSRGGVWSSVTLGTGVGATVLLLLAWLVFRTTTAPGGQLDSVNSETIFTSARPKANAPAQDLSGDGLFDAAGRYVMRDFDLKKPFSNFLPGLGGLWGLPLWTFYVNRGQGVCSFGIQNKDGAIAKYNSAEKVYQQTPFTGFRTFVRGRRLGGEEWSRMPFFPRGASASAPSRRDMAIGMNGLEIVETEDAIALETKIEYRPVTDEDFPALIRRTTFTNLDTRKPLEIEVLDGLGKLFPGGLPNYNLDAMGRTMEAWMNVYNMGANRTQPFFHVSQGTADTAQVQIVNDGHFVISFIENAQNQYSAEDLLPFVVDPRLVFGTDTTLTDASGFFGGRQGTFDEFMARPQATTSRTPCAFAGTKQTIKPRGSLSIVSVYGHASDLDLFLKTITPILLSKDFVPRKIALADKLVDDMTSYVSTTTSSPVFDKYVRQDFLDNVLRGGFPVVLGDPEKPVIYHTFSRIHGDLERDYNNYQIDATYFSQGPGNFRDVNQNRRNDVMHIPAVKDFNIRMFLSFVQADGYNPLTVATTNLRLKPEDAEEVIRVAGGLSSQETDSPAKLKLLLTSPFRIGTLFQLIKAQKISIGSDRKEFLNAVLSKATQVPAAQYAQNGFWADHWTYTLDLFDSYDYVFPDESAKLLYDVNDIPFFMSPAIVQDRRDRFSLVPDEERPGQMTVRAYSAVCQWGDSSGCFPKERQSAMNEIFSDPDYVADVNGAGGIWQRSKLGKPMTVSAFAKFLILGSVKFSTLDPLGMGVEYEGGKPGWNDAMNGLPGLIGSGMPETFEMLRILKFLLSAVKRDNRSIKLPTECSDFLASTQSLLTEFSSRFAGASKPDEVAKVEFEFWDRSNAIRETYRSKIASKFEGTEVEWAPAQLQAVLEAMVAKTEAGVRRAVAMTPEGMTPTYFYFESTEYELIPDERPPVPPMVSRRPIVVPKAFAVRPVPLFLEGPTRHLKVMESTEDKRAIFQLTKKSSLYDSFLKMFLISSSLKGCLQGIGRMMAFSAGWLENESVWLHMSYKFYLEMLKAGLYDEFFEEIKTGLVPFMDNERYGRSPLEAASFIASSAFPDASLHGAGFLARLSGSTAEFLSMWIIMMAGHNPFFIDAQGVLCLKLKPVLPGWLFTRGANTVIFTFLGTTTVTYHNALRSDTWTLEPKQATMVLRDGSIISAPDGVFRDPVAISSVRNQKAHSIDVFF